MPPKKKPNTAATGSSVGAPAVPRQATSTPAAAAAASSRPTKPRLPSQLSLTASVVPSRGTVAVSRSTAPTSLASAAHARAFYRTGRFVSAPPRTLMDLLRFYVEFFLLYAQPTVPYRTSTAASVAGAEKAPGSTVSNGGDCNGSYTAAAAMPAVVDIAAQVTTLTFISVPHSVCFFFEAVALLPGDGEAAPLPESGGKSAGRKRHRSSVAFNGTVLPAAGDTVLECDDDSDVQYQPSVMLQRLCEYGALQVPAFESDSAYLAAKDVLVYLKHYGYLVSAMTLSAAILRNVELVGLDFRQHCVPCVNAITQLVDYLINAQLRKMQLPPRVVRLSERLRLSAKAARTLEYLLVCHCGRYAPGNIADPLRPASIAYHNELTPQELLSILSESGVLWKQGLIFSDIKMRTTFMECKYALPMETIAALSGDRLSEEQLIKLERTALLEVLSEEQHTKTTNTAAASPTPRTEKHVGGRSFVSPSPKRGDEEGDVIDEEDDNTDAESAITPDEEALENVVDKIDPSVLTSKDQDTLHEAVSHHLRNALSSSTATPFDGCTTVAAAAKNAAVAETEEAVEDGERSKEELVIVTPSTTPTALPASSVAAITQLPEGVGEATTATSAPRKARLVLADINPLAQRYRNTGTDVGTAVAATSSSPPSTTAHTDSSMRGVPYESDIEYMDAAFRILANMIRIRYAEGDMKDEEDSYTPKSKVEASIRELKGKVRVAAAVHESRLQATLATRAFTPRVEQLAQRLQLTEMEKQIMLFMVGNVISHDMLVAVNGRYVMRDGQRLITVGYMLFVLCESLEERVVARRAFYQSSPLVSNGVLSLTLDSVGRSCFNTDLMDYLVDIDRKIVDDVMGITAETAEMVPGSQLYFPEVELANVMLPTATMDRVLSTIEHYSLFEQCKKGSGFGDGLGTSKGGLVMLFHGPSGTGKTMLANAVAHHLRKKILLVSVSQFRSSTKSESDALRFLFREAKLSDAILFFDECESLFEDRTSNCTVTALLSEFERYEGLIILATNRAQNFDEAMNRRVSLMMEFRPPDHQLRLRIWKSHIPKQLSVNADVCLEKLALNYELSGGLIRNAVLAALSKAVAREKCAAPELTMSDLDEGARLQLRGFFLAAELPEGMSEFYLTPKRTLAELVVESSLTKKLAGIASSAKSRNTLYTDWGFSEDANDDCGTLYLFQGVSGTGKSLAAEAIAYECGATIRLCNVAELLLREEMRVHAVFEEGRRLGAIIVFDEAQVLFNESPKSLQLSQLIQYHARRYPRPVIVIATTASRNGGGGRHLFSTTSINSHSSCMLFQSELIFALPSRPLREQLWRKAFPERVPTASDVDYGRLSTTSISPKLIRTIAFNVCCTAALLPVSERVVTMAMIEAEMERTMTRERSAVSTSAMFA